MRGGRTERQRKKRGVKEGTNTAEREARPVEATTLSQHPRPQGLRQLKTRDSASYTPKGTKRRFEILYDSSVLRTSASSPNHCIVSSSLSLAFGVGLPFIMGDAEIFRDIPSPVALLQKLGRENITCSGWKTSHGVQEGRRAGMPGYSANH